MSQSNRGFVISHINDNCNTNFPYLCSNIPLLTYLGLSFREEPRECTTVLQRTRFWAVITAFCQIISHAFNYFSVSRLQVFRNRFCFLFLWGFQVRAWHAVLDDSFFRVCPIHSYILCLICTFIGSCPAPHSSLFVILTGYWMLICACDRCCGMFESSEELF